jgi:hypothetical protein
VATPPLHQVRPHSSLGYRSPATAGRAIPMLTPRPLTALTLEAGMNG